MKDVNLVSYCKKYACKTEKAIENIGKKKNKANVNFNVEPSNISQRGRVYNSINNSEHYESVTFMNSCSTIPSTYNGYEGIKTSNVCQNEECKSESKCTQKKINTDQNSFLSNESNAFGPKICHSKQADTKCNNNNSHEQYAVMEDGYIQKDSVELYKQLKTKRDIECVKLTQASNLLREMRFSKQRNYRDELILEKILLESGEKLKLIVNKIRDLGYSEIRRRINHKGSICLTNFSFLLKELNILDETLSEFYILAVSTDTKVYMSNIVQPYEGQITFGDHSFIFQELDSNFNINVQLFGITYQQRKRRKMKKPDICPMSKIYYENVNTAELEESKILKSSFRSLASINLTKHDIGMNNIWKLNKVAEDCRIQDTATFKIQVGSVNIKCKKSGFLTLGQEIKGRVFWERKWCILEETLLRIFNYPSDVDFDKVLLTINLEDAIPPVLLEGQFAKKRTFLLKTAQYSCDFKKTLGEVKYFFHADDWNSFKEWSEEIGCAVDTLADWKLLNLPFEC